jgi:hypothetical protein
MGYEFDLARKDLKNKQLLLLLLILNKTGLQVLASDILYKRL